MIPNLKSNPDSDSSFDSDSGLGIAPGLAQSGIHFTIFQEYQLKIIWRRAARFFLGRYHNSNYITVINSSRQPWVNTVYGRLYGRNRIRDMLQHLNWESVCQWRANMRAPNYVYNNNIGRNGIIYKSHVSLSCSTPTPNCHPTTDHTLPPLPSCFPRTQLLNKCLQIQLLPPDGCPVE